MGAEAPIEHDLRWPVVSLAEIATKIGSGATPKGGADAYLPSRARFALVRSQNVFDRRFDRDGLAFISDEQADGLRGVVLQPDDILLNITGDGITFGRACMVPKDVLPACVNQHVSIIRLDPQRADAGYVLAFLTHRDVKSYIESFNAGGSRRAVTKGHIESFRLPLPPLPEQRAIAHILGTLDEKIELNRRMNEALEAMARAIFKSWFVDFDPVRTKAEGRDPGLPQPLADLFPDSFEESELGEIPKGWRVGPILDTARLLSGGTPKTDRNEYWSGGIPWASAKDVSQCGDSFLVETERKITARGLEESATQLISALCSVVVARGATTGRMVILGDAMAMNQTCYALATAVGTPFALYCHLRQEIGNLVHAAHGSVFDTITTSTFATSKVVLPPRPVLEEFEARVGPIFRRILAGTKVSRTLASLRDSLLPKLISGELRVKDADQRMKEEAV
jgi:type I restriction enzyme S subunit